jgi:hypothetical protein
MGLLKPNRWVVERSWSTENEQRGESELGLHTPNSAQHRGAANTAQDILALDNAFVLIDGPPSDAFISDS